MQILKEEIQAQIKSFNSILSYIQGATEDMIYDYCVDAKKHLEEQLQSAKSIKDIEREAFEAGREADYVIWQNQKYLRFEDYLKSQENDKTQ